jgi:methylenetetrahydrofolate dehydrogenase (NADP+)/methenyltetrahydrofolate cyclohydrolase
MITDSVEARRDDRLDRGSVYRRSELHMTATLIDGTAIAAGIQQQVAADVERLKAKGVKPGLAVVLVGEDPASASYVNMKARMCTQLGVESRKLVLPAATETADLLARVEELNADDGIDGILIQLPLPKQIEKSRVLETVDPLKDVDGFHSSNIGSLVLGHEALVACTPLGVMELLSHTGVRLEGARAVVLGRSDDVGKPVALLLMHQHATVTICHSRTRDLEAVTREADVVVAAIGRAAMVTDAFVKPGAVVIDVGSNKVSDRAEVVRLFGPDSPRLAQFDKRGYVWVGDVDERAVAGVASHLTPVPGGVGPMTIAMLMRNTLKAARLRRERG